MYLIHNKIIFFNNYKTFYKIYLSIKIIKNKSYKTNNDYAINKSNFKGMNKYFIPSNFEWNDSIYNYNSNNAKYLPFLDKSAYKLIKIYFNMFNKIIEKKLGIISLTPKKRWLSTRKVWINEITYKHSNDILTINIHLYDRLYNIISYNLKLNSTYYNKNKYLFSKLNKIIINLSSFVNKSNFLTILDFYLKKIFSDKKLVKDDYITQYNKLLAIFNNEKVKLLKTKLKLKKKLILIKYMEYYLLKYKVNYISILQNILSKLYKKKVIFNIILLKNFYLSSEILTKILTHKSKNRSNKIYKTFKNTLINIKVPMLKKSTIGKAKRIISDENIWLSHTLYNHKLDSILNEFNTNDTNMLNKLKYKSIMGVRLQAGGRLTKRFTAQRSIKKIKYIGTIRNIDSSIKGSSTKLIRNNKTSSLQYSKNSSNNRIGSFGIKGWINSM